MTDLIYCAEHGRRFTEIAVAAGFKYGTRLPNKVHARVYFADQDWKRPNRTKYMAALEKHRPFMATVKDWEQPDELREVIDWAEEAAQYVEVVVIIPKVAGGIPDIPRTIGGKLVRLGYSVPTKYGATELPLWEFTGWPVHLLGGSPHAQLNHARYIDVVSVDGNYSMKMAERYCMGWVPKGGSGKFVELQELDNKKWDKDAPYEAFRRSCANIMAAWKKFDRNRAEYAQEAVC